METKQEFSIDNDKQAEGYIDNINDKLVESAAYKQRLLDKIQQLQLKYDKEKEKEQQIIDNRNYYLSQYFDTIDEKLKQKTKTQEKYRLASGSIIKKYPEPSMTRDEVLLLDWVKRNRLTDYMETTQKTNWIDLKKLTVIGNGKVIFKPTGEIIEGITVEERDSTIEFKEVK